MSDKLDSAAVRSARALRALAKNPLVTRARGQAAIARAVAETVWERAEPRVESRVREAQEAVTSVPVVAAGARVVRARRAAASPHGAFATPDDGPVLPGDDEKCTCQGVGLKWCGATKRDVIHDLQTSGAQLTRDQAEHIWRSAQDARAAAAAPA